MLINQFIYTSQSEIDLGIVPVIFFSLNMLKLFIFLGAPISSSEEGSQHSAHTPLRRREPRLAKVAAITGSECAIFSNNYVLI